MGFRISQNFVQVLILKFDRQSRRSVKFDDFIQICVLLRSLTEAFKQRDSNLNGKITINYEDFMSLALAYKPWFDDFFFLTNHFRLSWTGLHPQSLATCSSRTSDNNIHVDMSLCSLYRLLPAVLCFVSCVQRVTEATGNHARNLPLSGSV